MTEINPQPPLSVIDAHSQAESPITELSLSFDDAGYAKELFGPQNANLNQLMRVSGIRINTRGSTVTLKGEESQVALAQKLLAQLYSLLRTGTRLHPSDVEHSYVILSRQPDSNLKSFFSEAVFSSSAHKSIVAKTINQRAYVEALRSADMTFAVGPAGTGKTYLAVAVALSMLMGKKVKRLILTRPAVEAGERLGFLPGDLAEKVNPYLRPLYDALHDMLDPEKISDMLENNVIEVAPLAFMRGRTLNNAFIILDEAQNTTPEQMKMFVTRLGFGSRAAITGDITQIDLPLTDGKARSGLTNALEVLKDVEGIRFLNFQKEDVIRHPLVGRIVQAYDNYQKYS